MRYVDLTSGNVVNLPEKQENKWKIHDNLGMGIRYEWSFKLTQYYFLYDYDKETNSLILNTSKMPNYLEPLD